MLFYPFSPWCPLKGHAYLKSPHSGLGQFLTTGSWLKVMKNAFYFMLTQLTFTYSKSIIETLKEGVKYVQS